MKPEVKLEFVDDIMAFWKGDRRGLYRGSKPFKREEGLYRGSKPFKREKGLYRGSKPFKGEAGVVYIIL